MNHPVLPPAGLLAVALLVAACAPDAGVSPADGADAGASTTTSTTVAPLAIAPADAGTIVVGIGTEGPPRTLNALLDGPDTPVLDLVTPAVYATAYRIDVETMDPVAVMLEEVPTTGNGLIRERGDGTIDVTVRVVPGAVWSDGVPVDTDDLAFTYEIAVDPSIPIRSDVRDRYAQIIPGSVVADGLELRFRMRASLDVELLFGVIVPRHQVEGTDFTADWNDTMWVGAGPFVFVSYQPGQYLEVKRNESWTGSPGSADGAPVDRIVFRFYRGDLGVDERLLPAFETRSLDVVLVPEAHREIAAYTVLAPEGAEVATAPDLTWEHLNFQFGPANRNEESLVGHREFREAVASAIDRDALAAARGTAPLSSVLALSRPGLTSDPWAVYPFDLERTKGRLWELGEALGVDLFGGDGPRLVLTTASESPEAVETAGDIVVMLGDAGIAAELQLEGAQLFYGRTLDDGTWDTATWRLTAGSGRASAAEFLRMFDPDGIPSDGSNFLRWGTPDSLAHGAATERYAAVIDALDGEMDRAVVDRLLGEAEEILAGELVLLPLMVTGSVGVAWWGDEVTGIGLDPGGGVVGSIGEWRIPGPAQ